MQLAARGQGTGATKPQEPSPRRGGSAQRRACAPTRSTSASVQDGSSASAATVRRPRAAVAAAATGGSLSSKGRGGEAPTQEDLRCVARWGVSSAGDLMLLA